MLASPVKRIPVSFPLGIEPVDVQIKQQEMNTEFIRHILPKLEWRALRQALDTLRPLCNEVPSLPDDIPSDAGENEQFLAAVHSAIMEVSIMEGCLVCPSTGRKFPIRNGIPNMLCSAEASSSPS
eukprot:c9075_g1_i1.p2 GENE.c9075_g1_i1~~c9075_g1_i1.p2  ORF type:complete len:138 (-),score=16.13 c9075_g1_i1:22-396(-)